MKASKKMDVENVTLAYSSINETIMNLDPYANNNGENNWIIIIFMIFIRLMVYMVVGKKLEGNSWCNLPHCYIPKSKL